MDELEAVVDPNDLRDFEHRFQSQARHGTVSPVVQFQYAWALVRTKDKENTRRGSTLLKDLYDKSKDINEKRDYIFYMAVAAARLEEYTKALKYLDGILQVQPGNQQVLRVREAVKKRMKNDGLVGMAIVGGAAAAVAGIVGLGVALSRR